MTLRVQAERNAKGKTVVWVLRPHDSRSYLRGDFVRDLLKLEEDTGDLVWYAPTRMYRYTAHPRAGR